MRSAEEIRRTSAKEKATLEIMSIYLGDVGASGMVARDIKLKLGYQKTEVSG